MSKKITCLASGCRFWKVSDSSCSAKHITISSFGDCSTYEKGLLHYVRRVWHSLERKNYVDAVEIKLDPDLWLGMFYVTALFHLELSAFDFGTSRLFLFRTAGSDDALNYEAILNLHVDLDRLGELCAEFDKGNTPGVDFFADINGTDQKEVMPENPPARETVKDDSDDDGFGWLAPDGTFFPSPWGNHEGEAYRICSKKGWKNEYRESGEYETYGDFISKAKGFCLIHNPSLSGRCIVTHTKPLTKKQREYLYSFFSDRGDYMSANHYFDELEDF